MKRMFRVIAIGVPVALTLAGCAPQLSNMRLREVENAAETAQTGFNVALSERDSGCFMVECNDLIMTLAPRSPDYSAADIGLAVWGGNEALFTDGARLHEFCFATESLSAGEYSRLLATVEEIPFYVGELFPSPDRDPVIACTSVNDQAQRDALRTWLSERGYTLGTHVSDGR